MSLDQDKLNEMLHRGVNDFGATFHAACVVLGDRLGLYKGLAAGGPQTPGELAKRTGTTERYVREWLSSQAAGGYVTLDADTGRFRLTEEQAFTLADEKSPAFLPGAFQLALAATKAVPRLTEAFRSGEGMGWHEHDHELFHGTERFFRPGYAANLVSQWIPTLTGVDERLKAGAKVADIGCGHGNDFRNHTEHGVLGENEQGSQIGRHARIWQSAEVDQVHQRGQILTGHNQLGGTAHRVRLHFGVQYNTVDQHLRNTREGDH